MFSSKYMGINKKNKTTPFEKCRIDNLIKQIGKYKEKEEAVINSKASSNTEGIKLSNMSTSNEKTPLLQKNNSSNTKELDKWTTYLAYLLKKETHKNKNNKTKTKTKTTLTVCKYEAL